jgi:hypothetical protein
VSWLGDKISSAEDEVLDAANYVEQKADDLVRWGAKETGLGYLVDKKTDGAQAGKTAPAATKDTESVGIVSELLDDAKAVGNAIYDELRAGPPGSPARMTDAEKTAYEESTKNLPETVKKKTAQLSSILDALTNPWVLGGLAIVVGLAVAGPYVLPFIRKAS